MYAQVMFSEVVEGERCVFFFKQKTAYDMRISDWSSDVCSSDLIARLDAKGFKPFLASELEFYLFDETFEGAHRKHYQDLKTEGYYIEDYHIFQTSKEEEVMRARRKGLDRKSVV